MNEHQQRTLIVAPPMTPNGDLHVGHMSGPYLAADVYRRCLLQAGQRAVFAVSSDDNQSYVDTTAARLRQSPTEVIERSRAEVLETLRTYAIGVDVLGAQDVAYAPFVTTFFERLHQHGFLRIAETRVLYDLRDQRYPVEAFVTGSCPNCLEPSCGGICEGCGHPNACTDLLGLDPARYEIRREPRLLFDLEGFRPDLERHLHAIGPHRPALRRLISSLLASPLRPFPVTYQLPRGLRCAVPGVEGQQWNVWAEMYAGHVYFLQKAAGTLAPSDRYAQFFGFDNSYFYVFLHIALAFAAERCGLPYPKPSGFVVNRFYNLEGRKFSTSQRHLVWARDLARSFNTDAIRLYLALNGPEYQEANFEREAFTREVGALCRIVNGFVDTFNAERWTLATGERASFPAAIADIMIRGHELHEFEMNHVARQALSTLQHMQRMIAQGQRPLLQYFPATLALSLAPLCPDYAGKICSAFGFQLNGWNSVPPAQSDRPLAPFESTK